MGGVVCPHSLWGLVLYNTKLKHTHTEWRRSVCFPRSLESLSVFDRRERFTLSMESGKFFKFQQQSSRRIRKGLNQWKSKCVLARRFAQRQTGFLINFFPYLFRATGLVIPVLEETKHKNDIEGNLVQYAKIFPNQRNIISSAGKEVPRNGMFVGAMSSSSLSPFPIRATRQTGRPALIVLYN